MAFVAPGVPKANGKARLAATSISPISEQNVAFWVTKVVMRKHLFNEKMIAKVLLHTFSE